MTRVRILVLLALLAQLGLVALLLYLALVYPAPATPAVLGAALGAIKNARRTRDPVQLSTPQDVARHLQDEWQRAFGASLWPGLGFGAIGYAVLAAFAIGVPDASAALGWRILGGITFGALAGVAAALGTRATIDLAHATQLLRGGRRVNQRAA